MGDTIEKKDIEVEIEDNKISFLGYKIKIPDSKVIEEMKKLVFKRISSKKSDKIMERLYISLNSQKYKIKS